MTDRLTKEKEKQK